MPGWGWIIVGVIVVVVILCLFFKVNPIMILCEIVAEMFDD